MTQAIETISLSAADSRHPGHVVDVAVRADADGTERPAIYVWATYADAESDDVSRAVAIYWLATHNY